MKTKSFYFITRLVAAVTIVLTSFSVASCDKDENSSNFYEGKILGKWVYEKQSYRFYPDGTGAYDSGCDVKGSFKYNWSGGFVFIHITYVSSEYRSVWHDEGTGEYNPDNDTFWIDGKRFVREVGYNG